MLDNPDRADEARFLDRIEVLNYRDGLKEKVNHFIRSKQHHILDVSLGLS